MYSLFKGRQRNGCSSNLADLCAVVIIYRLYYIQEGKSKEMVFFVFLYSSHHGYLNGLFWCIVYFVTLGGLIVVVWSPKDTHALHSC